MSRQSMLTISPMGKRIVILTAILLLHQDLSRLVAVQAYDIFQYKTKHNVDKFFRLISVDPKAQSRAQNELTIFGPSDAAMAKFKRPKHHQLILNHMANAAFDMNRNMNGASGYVTTRIGSMSLGSPPLWLTRKGNDFFVNGAKIIFRNLQAKSASNEKQILHIIDAVLEPLCPKSKQNSMDYIGLTAGKLLRNNDLYDLGGHSIGIFASKLEQASMKDKDKAKTHYHLYDKPGRHTFFIPVDSAFKGLSPSLVDEDVIAGHVVQDTLMFTNPIDKVDPDKKTATYDADIKSSIKVTAAIQRGNQRDPSERNKVYARSNTNKGNRNHARKQVLAEILIRNIPVDNGVVHLISKPLVIFAKPLWEYLKEEEDRGRLSKFARYVRLYGKDLKNKLQASTGSTVFAPSNEAFNRLAKSLGGESKLEELLRKQRDDPRILGMHVIDEQIPATDIRIIKPQNDEEMFNAKVPYPEGRNDRLWFYMSDAETSGDDFVTNDEGILTVDGLGVTATVVEPDIGATNGMIHVVDRVLGVPSSSIKEKLALDPMMKSTNTLGAQNHFNDMFEKEDMNFTYLVPSDAAWKDLNSKLASVHKILFMGDFAYQTRNILERHLKIGEALSLKQLVERSNKKGGVTMLRGIPELRFKEVNKDGETFVEAEWEDLKVRIIRPNLECTNGYIHVVDQVIVKQRDVVLPPVAAGASSTLSNVTFIFIALLVSQRISNSVI